MSLLKKLMGEGNRRGAKRKPADRKPADRKPRATGKRAANRSQPATTAALDAPIALTTIRKRMIVVAVFLAAGLTMATGRAVVMQTSGAPALKAEAKRNYKRTRVLDDWRGDIRDREGKLLAVTVHRWALTVDPSMVASPGETARALAPILDLPTPELLERIDPANARDTAVDKDALQNPAADTARKMTAPMVRLISRMWQTPRARLDARLDILKIFFQLEQLQTAAIFPLVNTLADGRETALEALSADLDRLRFYPTRGRRFAYVAHDLDDTTIRALQQARLDHGRRCRSLRDAGERCTNPLRYVFTRAEPRRYYPKRDLATQLLGIVGRESRGLSGVERGMDAILSGGNSKALAWKDHQGRRIMLDGLPQDLALGAPSVELTIDQQVQAIAEAELSRACLTSGARAGYAVVMSVKTGEVLAAANFPAYNPNTFKEWFADRAPLQAERRALAQARKDIAFASTWGLNRRAHPGTEARLKDETRAALERQVDAHVEYAHRFPNSSRNAAFLDVYEPGSIMKIFTVAAALEEGLVDLDLVFDLEGGDWELHDADDNVIHDVSRLKDGNVARILKRSSNIGAAKVAFLMGADTLDRYLRAFGFGASTHSGVPGEARGLLRPAAEWVQVELANISFGQGMAATGIQLVTALSALANGGKLMQPRVIKRVLSEDGEILHTWGPQVVRQVVSPKTARTVLDLMQGVVEPDGTGKRAYIPEWPVAGKTGTGQKPHLRKRGYSEQMWVNTFFGTAPANDPELAIVVLIDEPSGKHHGGGLIAAPAFRKIMAWSLNHLGVPSPFATAKRPVWLEPDVLQRRRDLPRQRRDDLTALAPPVARTFGGDMPVPDLRGLTMDRVRTTLLSLGLVPHIYGSGIAISQDVPVHQRVPAGSTVTVTFQPRAPEATVHAGQMATGRVPASPMTSSLVDAAAPRLPETPQADAATSIQGRVQ